MAVDPRHAEVKRLFSEALGLAPTARQSLLDAQCPEPELRAEVEGLLRAHDEAETGFLAQPPRPASEIDPARLGLERGWRVLRELARGGMGVVYLAERADGAYEQHVALKLMAPDVLPDQETLLRLRLERQILARLDHPNIARLLDGGTTEQGAPYLVMEYVDGDRLDRWCGERGLDVRARVELFLPICEAVAYAHRNLVVHRDLKPGNILVRRDGQPKLLDFGIAKLMGAELERTREGAQILTPRYASPEQVRGEPVSTLSDVYSLGVVLYELLTGRSPYGAAVETPPALARAVCEIEPAPPSGRVAAGSAAAELAPSRLRGDLDAVVLTCLRKRPEQRYASVEALSDDLRAWLRGDPVAARRGERLYQVGRFARRHWLGIGAASLVLLLSAVFVLQLQAQLRQTRIERDKQARTLAFVSELFRVNDPSEARGNSVTVREILDRGAGLLEADRSLEPEVRGPMLQLLGGVYRQLALLAPAEQALLAALSSAGPGEETAIRIDLAGLRTEQGRFDEAERELSTAEAAMLRASAQDDLLRFRHRFARGYLALRQGRLDVAEPDLEQAWTLAQRRFGPDSREAVETRSALGSLWRERGDLAAAEAEYRAALESLQRRDVDGWNQAKLSNNLAIIAADRSEFDLAGERFAQALGLIRDAVGDRHNLVAVGLGNVASMRIRQGDYAAALPMLDEALQIRREALGDSHPLVGTTLSSIAYLNLARGEFALADAQMQQALALQTAGFGLSHPHTLSTLRNQVLLRLAQGRVDSALVLNRDVIEHAAAGPGQAHPIALQARTRATWLPCLDAACELDAVREALAVQIAEQGEGHADIGEGLAQLALQLRRSGAAEGCDAVRRADEVLGRHLPPSHWDRQLVAALGQGCTDAGGDPGIALDGLRQRYGAGHPLLVALDAGSMD
jgi:eukaryotic-like serine/threonine-protein kinase